MRTLRGRCVRSGYAVVTRLSTERLAMGMGVHIPVPWNVCAAAHATAPHDTASSHPPHQPHERTHVAHAQAHEHANVSAHGQYLNPDAKAEYAERQKRTRLHLDHTRGHGRLSDLTERRHDIGPPAAAHEDVGELVVKLCTRVGGTRSLGRGCGQRVGSRSMTVRIAHAEYKDDRDPIEQDVLHGRVHVHGMCVCAWHVCAWIACVRVHGVCVRAWHVCACMACVHARPARARTPSRVWACA